LVYQVSPSHCLPVLRYLTNWEAVTPWRIPTSSFAFLVTVAHQSLFDCTLAAASAAHFLHSVDADIIVVDAPRAVSSLVPRRVRPDVDFFFHFEGDLRRRVISEMNSRVLLVYSYQSYSLRPDIRCISIWIFMCLLRDDISDAYQHTVLRIAAEASVLSPFSHHRSCWLEKITKLIPVRFSFPISLVYTFPDERVNCLSRYIRSRSVPFILRPSGKRRFYLDRLRERDKSFIFEDKKKKCFLREKEREKEEVSWFKLRSCDPSSSSRDVQTHLLHSGVILVGISQRNLYFVKKFLRKVVSLAVSHIAFSILF